MGLSKTIVLGTFFLNISFFLQKEATCEQKQGVVDENPHVGGVWG